MAVSFITGKIVYISDQAAFILRCKREVFKGAKFSEFLAPQDVSIFYGSTAPYHLPSWSVCTSACKLCPCWQLLVWNESSLEPGLAPERLLASASLAVALK